MSKRTFELSRDNALGARRWYVVDAEGAVLGRLATRVAMLLRGKGKPSFTPYLDCGDFVVVVNAEKVRLTGTKEEDKQYIRHTGYPGGIRRLRAHEVRARHPERMIEQAVTGMLPRNRLGRALATKLKVYAGPEHPHAAQRPESFAIGES
ncbi:MAG: large subunit ribosomal protein [Candidatus Binatota bacterium]|nr:large subunit ribosomal protein [Candidatus Binatota bacterium]